MAVPSWLPKPPEWTKETAKLLLDSKIQTLPEVRLNELINNSKKFPIKFPISTCRCETLKHSVGDFTLENNINSVYPIVHEKILEFYGKFILFKRHHGSKIERAFYKKMSLKDFVDRLLKKRAVMFVGSADQYMLVNGKVGCRHWENIGTDEEKSPLTLQNCLSYDEIKCSAFLSVSSYTYFLNLGERYNEGVLSNKRDEIEDTGIIIGIIGTRFEKFNVMEYQEIIISDDQNTEQNGYGTSIQNSLPKLFSELYEEKCLDYKEVFDYRKQFTGDDQKLKRRYTKIRNDQFFDNQVYSKRLAFSFDTLLMEANYRAKLKGKTAFLHVVGFGLGVWKVSEHQEKVFLTTFAKRIM